MGQYLSRFSSKVENCRINLEMEECIIIIIIITGLEGTVIFFFRPRFKESNKNMAWNLHFVTKFLHTITVSSR